MSSLLPVTLSQKAADQVLQIMQTKKIPPGYGLRVGIRGGSGCGGHQLILGFDKHKDTDMTYSHQGIQVLVDKKHVLYVIGKEVDFYEGGDAKGFVFVDTGKGGGQQD